MTKPKTKRNKRRHSPKKRNPKGTSTEEQSMLTSISRTKSGEATPTSRFRQDFKNIGIIGKGAFGVVYRVTHRLDLEDYALKRIKIAANAKGSIKKILKEVTMLTKVNHQNVVRYINSWIEDKTEEIEDSDLSEDSEEDSDGTDDDDGSNYRTDHPSYETFSSLEVEHSLSRTERFLFIQMECCGKDTVRTYITNGLCQSTTRRMRMLNQIISGLEFIHSKNIIHRDLKPENIFVQPGKHEKVKIGDFGLATRIPIPKSCVGRKSSRQFRNDKLTTNIGSSMYIAPEMITEEDNKTTYGTEVDIYSLGIILFEMCYKPMSTGMERCKVLSGVRSVVIEFPPDFDDLEMEREVYCIRTMLNHDPSLRPHANEIKKALSKKQPSRELKTSEVLHVLLYSKLSSCPMSLEELEAWFVKNCIASGHVVESFKDACGVSLEQFVKRTDRYKLIQKKHVPKVVHASRPTVQCRCRISTCSIEDILLPQGIYHHFVRLHTLLTNIPTKGTVGAPPCEDFSSLE